MLSKLFVGPMWSGKTTRLVEESKKVKMPIFVDMYNSRNTQRDLKNMVKKVYTIKELLKEPNPETIFLDELHLWPLTNLFLLLESFPDSKIYGAGLLLDYYENFALFPYCRHLFPLVQEGIEILKSFKKCNQCSSSKDVIYTISVGETKIGDDYVNICKKCYDTNREKYLHKK